LNIPKRLKAFGRVYQIKRENDITGMMEVWGFVDSCKDYISIKKRDDEFTEGHEKTVFLHEIIHVIDNTFHVGLDESQVQTLAVGLVTIMTDNLLDFSNDK
jgi:hypothetical protein